jgi:hypothetical protein
MVARQIYYVPCPECGDPVGPIPQPPTQLKVTCFNSECKRTFHFDPQDVRLGTVSDDVDSKRLRLESFEHLMK